MLHGMHTTEVFIDTEHSLPLSEASPYHLGKELTEHAPVDDYGAEAGASGVTHQD